MVIPLRVRWRFFLGWLDSGPWLRPADPFTRCFMGAPIGPRQHCRRPIAGNGLWCDKHDPGENPCPI